MKGKQFAGCIFLLLFSSCFSSYKIFDFTRKDAAFKNGGYGRVLFSDSLITIYFYKDYSDQFKSSIRVEMNSDEKLIIDSIGVSYAHLLKNGTTDSNTGIRKPIISICVDTVTADTEFIGTSGHEYFYFSNFKDAWNHLKVFSKKGQVRLYEYDSYNLLKIPKYIKRLLVNISIQYHVGQSIFIRNFPIEFKNRTHVYFYFLGDG